MEKPEKISSIIRSLEGSDRVEFIVLYGSVSEGNVRQGSDMDICILYAGDEFERSAFRFSVLSALMDDEIDVHMFNDLPLYIRKDIFKGRVLYCKDEVRFHDLAYIERRRFEDFAPRYHDYIGMEALG